MFKPHRVFSVKNQASGKPEWYFQAREGNIGPYDSRVQAEFMLKKFVERCIELGSHGGRNSDKKDSSTAVKLQSFLNYELKGDVHWY